MIKNKMKYIPILMYHEIIDDSYSEALLRKMQRSYFVKNSIFKQQMDFLSRNKFETISLYNLVAYLNDPFNNSLPDKCVIITFDDGYGGNYKYAFPVLEDHNFTASFFITVNSVGNEFMMDWGELKNMSDEGMSIQSHTLTHPFLRQLKDEEVKKELAESKSLLEERLGIKVDFISLPHGSYGNSYKNIARELGYLGGCSSESGVNRIGVDVYFLRRINISGDCGLSDFEQIVQNDTILIHYLTFKKRCKILIKNLIGERLYLKLYNIIFGLGD